MDTHTVPDYTYSHSMESSLSWDVDVQSHTEQVDVFGIPEIKLEEPDYDTFPSSPSWAETASNFGPSAFYATQASSPISGVVTPPTPSSPSHGYFSNSPSSKKLKIKSDKALCCIKAEPLEGTPELPFSFPYSPSLGGVKMIGAYTIEERRARIQKHLEKRKRRIWDKKVSYDCRKKVADSRLRIKGRFVRKEEAALILAKLNQIAATGGPIPTANENSSLAPTPSSSSMPVPMSMSSATLLPTVNNKPASTPLMSMTGPNGMTNLSTQPMPNMVPSSSVMTTLPTGSSGPVPMTSLPMPNGPCMLPCCLGKAMPLPAGARISPSPPPSYKTSGTITLPKAPMTSPSSFAMTKPASTTMAPPPSYKA
eukprot:GILJ01001040.1.p1 GENE.GILJ01001040.1~~GILJ01001040.1.p1  ORF type:complete len:426 (+),score=54.12 GILJ01001040.1:179-1279(+)